jgi:tubulin polyglutamylase TTLL4
LRVEYEKEGADWESVWDKIKDVIIKTILSVETPIVTSMGGTKYKNTCFEVYGFDILIDQTFRPWLLEVNVSPSLSSSSPMDKYIKTLLLSDSFYLSGFNIFDRKQIEKNKAKIDKQRLLGFDSSTKMINDDNNSIQQTTNLTSQNTVSLIKYQENLGSSTN